MEKFLVLYLRFISGVLFLALAAVFMPRSWMAEIHRAAQLGEMPEGILVDYLARSASLVYATWGGLYLYTSFDIYRYFPFLKFLCWIVGGFGLGMLILDLSLGMPILWTLGEGPMIVLHAGLLRWLLTKSHGPPLK